MPRERERLAEETSASKLLLAQPFSRVVELTRTMNRWVYAPPGSERAMLLGKGSAP